jgi:hypothetical protein
VEVAQKQPRRRRASHPRTWHVLRREGARLAHEDVAQMVLSQRGLQTTPFGFEDKMIEAAPRAVASK